MLTLLCVIYGVSNHRELRALWQMQRHALVHYYKQDVVPANIPGREWWLTSAARWWGLLQSPPVVDGQPVEPVVSSLQVPRLGYLGSCMAWGAYTSPK